MVKPRAALPILDQAQRQRHRELARRPTQDTRRHLGRVLQKPAEISHRPQLQCETETVDLAAPHGDPHAVIIGEEKATGQLIVRQLPREAPVVTGADRDRELQNAPVRSHGSISRPSIAACRSAADGRL